VRTEERCRVDGIPATTVPRTLVDLAEVVSPHDLERAVHQCYRLRRFDSEGVAACLARHPGRNGPSRLRALLADHPDGAERSRSWLEVAMLTLCRRHGLPLPRVNVVIEGRERDFHWPERGLVVEVDGRDEHLTPIAFEDDRRRDRALHLAGYIVLRFTYRDVTDTPDEVAADIRAALGAYRPSRMSNAGSGSTGLSKKPGFVQSNASPKPA
jgi:very-short-patch-repair endonuclease